MNPESPSFGARLRAMVAGALASMAAGARRLEEWSARGSRPVLLGLLALAVLVIGVIAVATQSRQVAAWFGDDRPAHARSERSAGKPQIKHVERSEGKHERGPSARPDARTEARPGWGPAGRPEAPRPPAPPVPAPPAPPQPPAP